MCLKATRYIFSSLYFPRLSRGGEEICESSVDSATFRNMLPDAVVILAAGTVNQTCMLALCLHPVIIPWCPHSFSQGMFLTELPWWFFCPMCYLYKAGKPKLLLLEAESYC